MPTSWPSTRSSLHAGSVDAVWHLGDVVGYGPDPDGVVDRLAEIGARRRPRQPRRRGGRRRRDRLVQPGRPRGRWSGRASTIATTTRAWLAGAARAAAESTTSALVHGSPRDPLWEYVDSVAASRRANLAASTTRLGLHGHTHLPIAFAEDGDGASSRSRPRTARRFALDGRRALLNPGSVGQPRDGDPRPRVPASSTPSAGTATWHRSPTTSRAVQAAMRAAGLPRRLVDPPVARRCERRAVIGGRRPLQGRKPGDRRVRVERPHAPYFRYTGPAS